MKKKDKEGVRKATRRERERRRDGRNMMREVEMQGYREGKDLRTEG